MLIVDCDLLGICDEIDGEIKEAIRLKTGIDPTSVMISCTHTHYGPDLYKRADRPDAAAYQENLMHVIAGAAAEAMENRREAMGGIGYGESAIGINRREKVADGSIILGHNHGGTIDRQVGVFRIDSVFGEPILTIVNFATHPVSQGSGMRTISADFPGQTRKIVQQLTGAPCMFLQGACGNINSILMDHSYEPPRTLGTRLGCEAVRVRETITTGAISGVERVTSELALPRYRYQSLENAKALAEGLQSELASLRESGDNPGSIYWAESRLQKVNDAIEAWDSGTTAGPLAADLGALRIGDLCIVTAPGEIFCQIGMDVKSRSPFANTFFNGYSGGTIGYIPVPKAYQEGGYEVTHACNVDPDAAGMIIEGSLSLLQQLV